MNSPTSQPLHDSAAEDQAALWAARLEGSTLDAADRIALDTWLAEKPAHRALLSAYCQFSADLEQHLPALVDSGAITMPAAALAPAPRRRWSFSWLNLAGGSLAAAAVAALVLWIGQPASPRPELIATSVAQRQTVTLSDGTRVELNAQTSLLVENTRDERRVRLASGEAFFIVAKDPSRPFIVETPTGSVRVTGTVFDVRTDKISALDVTVVEGSVQVRPADPTGTGGQSPSTLTAHRRLTANKHGVTVRLLSASDLDDTLAWRHGQTVFEQGVTLRLALERFAQYHGRGITVSPGAANLSIGGRFNLDNLDEFYDSLTQLHPVRINRDPSGLVRVSLLSEP